jgi:hypothetical protein
MKLQVDDNPEVDGSTIDPESLTLEKPLSPDQVPKFKGISAIAERLNIPEVPLGTQDQDVLIVDNSGKAYSIIAIVTGVLEYIHATTLTLDVLKKSSADLETLKSEMIELRAVVQSMLNRQSGF